MASVTAGRPYHRDIDETPTADLETALDELYGVTPEDFVLVRSKLERALRGAGDPDAAAALKRHRRPHLAAWACNQLVRTEPDAIEDLVDATAAVAAAQEGALRGGDAEQLREAVRARADLLTRLAEEGVRLARGHAPKPVQYRDAIADTLDAATLDPAATDELRRGRLTKPLLPPSGFGPPVAVAPRERAAPAPPRRGRNRERQRAERAATSAAAAARAADEAVGEADAEAASAELDEQAARAHLDDVERARERAQAALADARSRTAAARDAAEQSRRAARDARRAAEEARASLTELDAD